MKLLFFICITVLVQNTFSTDTCGEHKTCNDCIRDSNLCAWCASEQKRMSKTRCISEKSVTENWCPGEKPKNPDFVVKVMGNKDFSSNVGNIIQLKPQKITIKMRPGQTVPFNFSFNPAKHYPVDLYFLMDASQTMSQLKEHTSEQSTQLYHYMSKLTNNVKIGLGTFVDKNALPFAIKKDSTIAYSFKHHLMTDDFNEFKTFVDNIEFGHNNDTPEGGLDALAQVIICKNINTWRNESRKIVIFLTDAPSHAAGDGKWGGITEPYDGQCYMENQIYTKELEMDYPSIAIIDNMASENEVMIIFLVQNVEYIYNEYKKLINGSRVISYNEYSGEGMATALSNIYKTISQAIILKVNKPSKYSNLFDLSFNPDCNTSKPCNVVHGTEINFSGSIKLLKYNEANTITVDIGIQGINEKLTLNIEIIRECDCEKGNNTLCLDKGIRRCGVCECFPNRHGDTCGCTKGDTTQDTPTCMAPNSTTACSGHGVCQCGSCVCTNGYNGNFCECYSENCPRDEKGVCGGHGKCKCGKCTCDAGWSSNTCNCAESKDSCLTGQSMCFGYGDCKCGICKCTPLCEWDARSAQDDLCRPIPCPDCHSRQCQLLEPYALANINKVECTGRVNITSVQNLTSFDKTDWYICSNVRTDVGCYTRFIYKYDDETYTVSLVVESERDCANSYYIYGGACLGAIVLIGIVTLAAWKVLTVHRDRKEYNRFMEHSRLETNESKSPIFEPATTTFTNPAFRRQSIFKD